MNRLITAFVVLACLTSQASASTANIFHWGEGLSGSASVEVIPTQFGYKIAFVNQLVSYQKVVTFQFLVEGGVISGSVNSEIDVAPDTMTITPPTGYWCGPCEVTVDEGHSAIVELFPEVGA